jgi:hypothetical protein
MHDHGSSFPFPRLFGAQKIKLLWMWIVTQCCFNDVTNVLEKLTASIFNGPEDENRQCHNPGDHNTYFYDSGNITSKLLWLYFKNLV